MPKIKPPADPKKALVGCGVVVAIVATTTVGVAWYLSESNTAYHMGMFAICMIVTGALAKMSSNGSKK